MKKWIALLAITMSFAVCSGELSGVKVDDSVKVAGTDLQLNGMGIRIKYMVAKVYVAAFYAAQKVTDGEAAINAATPRRMSMTVLRKVETDDIYKSLKEGMEANNSPDEMAALAPKLKEMNSVFAAFKTVEANDNVTLDFLPGKGTQISVKGKVADVIPGDDFAKALLRIWFGKKPLQEDLKKKLLGG